MCGLKSWFEVSFRDVAARISADGRSQFWIPVKGKCAQEVPTMRLLMPEQETDPQVGEPTSAQSLVIISEFNYER